MSSSSVSTNPFIHRLNLKPFDYIKLAVATFTIFPIRFILSFIIFLTSCTWANIAYFILYIVGDVNRPEEYHKLRKQLIQPCLWLLRAMLWISGIRKITHIDKSNGTSAPILLFAPHTTFFDLYPGIFLPDTPSFVSRSEAQQVHFFGSFLKLAGTIFVKRESQSSRQETIEIIKSAAKNTRIAICPEGVCGNGSQMMKFKVGAFSPGLPVQPVILKYHFSSGYDTSSWTPEGPPFHRLVWFTLCQLYMDIEATVLPRYDPSDEEKNNPKLFAENVRKYISKVSCVPCSPYIFDDVFFFKLAKEIEISRSPVCIKLLKLSYKISELGKSQELTAQTERGTKSEDTNLLFARRKSDSKIFTIKNLQILTQKIKCHNESGLFDIANVLQLPPELRESNAIGELMESVTNRDLSPHKVLKVAGILCDINSGSIWSRVKDAFDYLSDNQENLNNNQWKGLLWVLIGVTSNLVDVKEENVTFEDVKKNICLHYQRAVDDNIPSLSRK